jgi:two-component system, OmpR family, response regulator
LPELEARVRALLRRGANASTPMLQHGRLRFDTVGRRVFYDDQPVELSARELAVLEMLLMREGRVVSKEHIVNHLYGWGDEVAANAIEVYVYRIRRKLEPLGCEIRTVRGMGYLMERVDGPA